jgi:hypothetical protein
MVKGDIMTNKVLLAAVMERIEHESREWLARLDGAENPRARVPRLRWFQGRWGVATLLDGETGPQECNTAFCFAGWTAVLAGGQILWSPAFSGAGELSAHELKTPDGRYQMIRHYAQLQLQIDDRVADLLFSPYNELADLRAMVAELLNTGTLGSYAPAAHNRPAGAEWADA